MGNMTAYALGSALCLVLCWLPYRLFLEGKKQPGFNRRVIIAIYILSLIWLPTIGLVERFWPRVYRDSPVQIGIDSMMISLETIGEGPPAPWWALASVSIYTAGLIVASLWMAVSLFSIWTSLRNCRRVECQGYRLLVSRDSELSPFSWGNYVVLSEKDYACMNPLILSHELAHLRHFHWLDLLLGQGICVMQWFNPVAWLFRRELVMNHEYEADAEVMNDGGDARAYQFLLLRRAIGENIPNPLTPNLRTSNLKKRIAMMKRNESGRSARFGALALIPALAVAWLLNGSETFAYVSDATAQAVIPVSASAASSSLSTAIFSEPQGVENDSRAKRAEDNISLADKSGATDASLTSKATTEADDAKVYLAPQVIPEFPGGIKALMSWLGENIHYPAAMVADNIEGRVIVQFVVEKDGKVSNPRLVKGVCPAADEEALRVVGEMPAWIPGREGGKPVACQFTLPISFKLEKEDGTTTDSSSNPSAERPTYFVDGELFTGDLNTIDPQTIESMTVNKSDPTYPEGRIDIKLKH